MGVLRGHPVVQNHVVGAIRRVLDDGSEGGKAVRKMEAQAQITGACGRGIQLRLPRGAGGKAPQGVDTDIRAESQDELEIPVACGVPVVFSDDAGVLGQFFETLQALSVAGLVAGDAGDGRVVVDEEIGRHGTGDKR